MIYINLSELIDLEGFDEEDDEVEIVFDKENFKFKCMKNYGNKSSIILEKVFKEEIEEIKEIEENKKEAESDKENFTDNVVETEEEFLCEEDRLRKYFSELKNRSKEEVSCSIEKNQGNNEDHVEETEKIKVVTEKEISENNKGNDFIEMETELEVIREEEEESLKKEVDLKILNAAYNVLTKGFSLSLNKELELDELKNNFFDIFEINLLEKDGENLKFVNKIESITLTNKMLNIRFNSFQSLDLSQNIRINILEENIDGENNFIEVKILKHYMKNNKQNVQLLSGQEVNKIISEVHFLGIVESFDISLKETGYLFTDNIIKIEKIDGQMYAINNGEKALFKNSEETYMGFVDFKEASISLKLPTGIKKNFNLRFKFLEHAVIAIWDYNNFMCEVIEKIEIENIKVIAVG